MTSEQQSSSKAPRALRSIAVFVPIAVAVVAVIAVFFTASWQGYPEHADASPDAGASVMVDESARRVDAARLMQELTSGTVPVGGPFALTDPAGQIRRLDEFQGQVVVLYFGYATCPDVCPTDLMSITGALRALGSDAADVQPLFVTLDPERDHAGVLREYLAGFHPRFIGLRGSEAEVTEVARNFRVFHRKVPAPGRLGYLIDHSAVMFILDRKGQYVRFMPPGASTERIAVTIREVIATHR